MAQRKIRMRTRYATAERSIEPGVTAVLDADEAKALVDGGYAVYVSEKGEDQLPSRIAPGKATGAAGKSGPAKMTAAEKRAAAAAEKAAAEKAAEEKAAAEKTAAAAGDGATPGSGDTPGAGDGPGSGEGDQK